MLISKNNELSSLEMVTNPEQVKSKTENQSKSAKKLNSEKDKLKTNNKNKEKNQKNTKNNLKKEKTSNRTFYQKSSFVEPPDSVITKEYVINEENVLYFNGPNHFLSALYPVKVEIDGNEYNSVEHYYQACKLFTLVGKEVAALTKQANTPVEVKQLTKKLLRGKVTKEEVENWKLVDSFLILQHAILKKFTQSEDLKKLLLETGNKILIQTYNGDNFFATGTTPKQVSEWVKENENKIIKVPKISTSDDYQYVPFISNGKNILGFISMQVRDKIRETIPSEAVE